MGCIGAAKVFIVTITDMQNRVNGLIFKSEKYSSNYLTYS